MKKHLILSISILLLLTAFRRVNEIPFIVPFHFPQPVYNFEKNPLTTAKIALGRALFYDPILSKDNTISCASCHLPFTAFTHIDHALSHGIDDRIGTRNSPALMNLAWHKSFMWDGAVNHLDMQALAPISNALEMDEKIEHLVAKLQAKKPYPMLFYQAFGDSLITGEHTLKAISQFMLTLVSANARYDSVIRKEAIFTEQEQKGYVLFQQHCNVCHIEPLFTSLTFENNGLPLDTNLNDFGRMRITQNADDSLKFKVPTLRNIEFSMPYMHDGRFKRLNDVLKHYTTNVQQSKTLSPHLQKQIVLSSHEKVDLTAFLLTLTDRSFLFDKRFSYPK